MKYFLLVFLILLFCCCKTDRSVQVSNDYKLDMDPKISRVETIIYDYTMQETIPARITFNVFLEDYRILDQISSITIFDSEDVEWIWTKSDLDNAWKSKSGYFSLDYNRTSYHEDYIPLGKYKITLKTTKNKSSDFDFEVYGRANIKMLNGKIYANKSNFEPKILLKPENINVSNDQNFIYIYFDNKDEIINDAYLWFYDENNKYIKASKWLSEFGKILHQKNNQIKIPKIEFADADNFIILFHSKTTKFKNTVFYTLVGDKYKIEK